MSSHRARPILIWTSAFRSCPMKLVHCGSCTSHSCELSIAVTLPDTPLPVGVGSRDRAPYLQNPYTGVRIVAYPAYPWPDRVTWRGCSLRRPSAGGAPYPGWNMGTVWGDDYFAPDPRPDPASPSRPLGAWTKWVPTLGIGCTTGPP